MGPHHSKHGVGATIQPKYRKTLSGLFMKVLSVLMSSSCTAVCTSSTQEEQTQQNAPELSNKSVSCIYKFTDWAERNRSDHNCTTSKKQCEF